MSKEGSKGEAPRYKRVGLHLQFLINWKIRIKEELKKEETKEKELELQKKYEEEYIKIKNQEKCWHEENKKELDREVDESENFIKRLELREEQLRQTSDEGCKGELEEIKEEKEHLGRRRDIVEKTYEQVEVEIKKDSARSIKILKKQLENRTLRGDLRFVREQIAVAKKSQAHTVIKRNSGILMESRVPPKTKVFPKEPAPKEFTNPIEHINSPKEETPMFLGADFFSNSFPGIGNEAFVEEKQQEKEENSPPKKKGENFLLELLLQDRLKQQDKSPSKN